MKIEPQHRIQVLCLFRRVCEACGFRWLREPLKTAQGISLGCWDLLFTSHAGSVLPPSIRCIGLPSGTPAMPARRRPARRTPRGRHWRTLLAPLARACAPRVRIGTPAVGDSLTMSPSSENTQTIDTKKNCPATSSGQHSSGAALRRGYGHGFWKVT
jgi:hypothetical protein